MVSGGMLHRVLDVFFFLAGDLDEVVLPPLSPLAVSVNLSQELILWLTAAVAAVVLLLLLL